MKDRYYFLTVLIGLILAFISLVLSATFFFLETKEDWKDYDNYILSLYWAPTFCYNKRDNNEECYEKLDELGINNSFIIHGLWPTYSNDEYIKYCNPDDININFNKNYEEELKIIWPGLMSSDYEMWNHEYNKHGYCYIKRIGKNPITEYKYYFDKTKEILGEFNKIMEVILPDLPKGFHNITKNKFQKFIYDKYNIDSSTYLLRCINNKESNEKILSEIWFNYDINMKRTNISKLVDECPDTFQLYIINENNQAVWDKAEFYVIPAVWMPTVCKLRGKSCYKELKSRILKYPELLNNLTAHGIWLAYKNGQEHQWCNIGEDIEIVNYTENMTIYWNDIYDIYGDNNKEFWKNEYNKEGYCYNKRMNVSTDNYLFYFNETLFKYFYDYMNTLTNEFNKGFFPGINTINRNEINDFLSKKYGSSSFSISCINFNGDFFLYEIRRIKRFEEDWRSDPLNINDNCSDNFYIEYIEVEGPQEEDENLYKNYDMYYFVISWLNTFCHIKGSQCFNRIAERNNLFTIRGLWPYLTSLENTNNLKWCNGKNDIEIEEMPTELFDFLNKSFINGYNTQRFLWEHEYNKHGYCYNKRNNFDVYNYSLYFQKIKDIFEENKFENMFIDFFSNKSDINDEYMVINKTEFENYFDERGFHKDTYLIVCENITNLDNNINYPNLLEIRIKYDLNFKLLKKENDKSEFDCPELFYVKYL